MSPRPSSVLGTFPPPFLPESQLVNRLCRSLIEEGGDWDRRNRLKVYQGLYCVAIRDFKQAAELFLDTVSTFTSYELMDYKTFVTYTVYVCMIALKRPDLREKVMHWKLSGSTHLFLVEMRL